MLASSGSFGSIAGCASVAVVAVYLLAWASAWQLQRLDVPARDIGPAELSRRRAEPEPLCVPPFALAARAAFCIALLAQATSREPWWCWWGR